MSNVINLSPAIQRREQETEEQQRQRLLDSNHAIALNLEYDKTISDIEYRFAYLFITAKEAEAIVERIEQFCEIRDSYGDENFFAETRYHDYLINYAVGSCSSDDRSDDILNRLEKRDIVEVPIDYKPSEHEIQPEVPVMIFSNLGVRWASFEQNPKHDHPYLVQTMSVPFSYFEALSRTMS